ncbi:uncharacterized protein L969DRAFT_96869 [Mixia osmundae IAM 14324]|uniref:Uncharacterized protein n=1 Tax=Mixia osmundae (strain CBS 9802 / IAM 14324 / JCM 22182 / KY 12970) TaxID=764103 RepID=G7E2B9_MIXOS|nr:uncharacterized protein L969DRAFT_96869 [Mixia osmundae IAM 14324]KEI36851.1 hypothetical protein L969DRAFT_96869 [Mixia osmundae IAM 14324]GAA96979.1 hypothetical protein E5Q_03653 [Mixia osmundae IAM 14324]
MFSRFAWAFLLAFGIPQSVAAPSKGHHSVGSPGDTTASVGTAHDIGIGKLASGFCALDVTATDGRHAKIKFELIYDATVGNVFKLQGEDKGEFPIGDISPIRSEYAGFSVAEFQFPSFQPAEIDLVLYYNPGQASLAYHLKPSQLYKTRIAAARFGTHCVLDVTTAKNAVGEYYDYSIGLTLRHDHTGAIIRAIGDEDQAVKIGQALAVKSEYGRYKVAKLAFPRTPSNSIELWLFKDFEGKLYHRLPSSTIDGLSTAGSLVCDRDRSAALKERMMISILLASLASVMLTAAAPTAPAVSVTGTSGSGELFSRTCKLLANTEKVDAATAARTHAPINSQIDYIIWFHLTWNSAKGVFDQAVAQASNHHETPAIVYPYIPGEVPAGSSYVDITLYYKVRTGELAYHLSPSIVNGLTLISWSVSCQASDGNTDVDIPRLY